MSRRLVMVGPAPQARGTLADVVAAYRTGGLFKRWPVDYVATRGGLRRFVALLARERSPVVHLHVAAKEALGLEMLFMAAALAAHCPLILHLHDDGLARLRDGAGMALRALRFVLERAACVAVPCEALRAWVAGITPHARVEYVPSPVPAPDMPQPERRNLVLFMSALEARSGVAELVEAVAGLRSAVPDLRLVCAAPRGDRASVERLAGGLGVEDAVKFTGWVGPSGKRALFESAAVFALPSYEEALPLEVLQAMAAGIPVVASSVGGLAEVIRDGVNGFLVAAGDTAGLQRALRRLLLDRALAARIGAAARESVRLRFAPERALPRLEALYAAVGISEQHPAKGPHPTPA
jgi:glycosyltransferase involved in cell wall biosynthesis